MFSQNITDTEGLSFNISINSVFIQTKIAVIDGNSGLRLRKYYI